MESLIGHVVPGLAFLLMGLWHLFNNTKLHSLNPKTYTSSPFFSPSPTLKYLEPTLIVISCFIFISTELFVGPEPRVGPDWAILPSHLRNFEHSSIALALLVFACSTVIFDRSPLPDPGLTWLAGAAVFSLEFLLFHFHSNDHMGVVGQYHWLVQLLIAACLATTLIGAWRPGSFLVSFVRSASVAAQGVWFMIMGFGMWVPVFVPKGCGMSVEGGMYAVRCTGQEQLERAKSLVNIVFSWFLCGMMVFCVVFYLVVASWYCEGRVFDEEGEKKKKKVDGCDESDGFLSEGKMVRSFELEL